MITDKRIFITGGTGYLGKCLISRYYNTNEIVVYSRDEAKQYYLKKQFPNIKCIIGDVRNYDLMKSASKGCNVGIFTASMKQIDSVNENISEATEVIINGSLNSKRISIENEFECATFISSDKSRSATTIYGAMKFVAGESFIIDSDLYNPNLSSVIYGNVLNSTGSVIPLIWDAIRKGYELNLYSTIMTRFIIDIERAVDIVDYALTTDGYNIIPKLDSMLILDLFEIYRTRFGLRYKITQPRISEKLHETMISHEESVRCKYDIHNSVYLMHYLNVVNSTPFEYVSNQNILSYHMLDELLDKYDYFK
jgi:UDP-N-acetylglucosamine 4,6-dehydratase/5-epimerase